MKKRIKLKRLEFGIIDINNDMDYAFAKLDHGLRTNQIQRKQEELDKLNKKIIQYEISRGIEK